MFPDGGIARLRAYGVVVVFVFYVYLFDCVFVHFVFLCLSVKVAVASLPDSPHSLVDLTAATNGGVSSPFFSFSSHDHSFLSF